MEELGKNPRPYRGIGFILFFLALVPAVVFTLIYFVLEIRTYYSGMINVYMSLAITGVVATLFNFICVLCGLFKNLIRPLGERIRDFIDDVKITPKEAFKDYFYAFYRDGGILLWILILWIIFCMLVSAFGFIKFFEWYNALWW